MMAHATSLSGRLPWSASASDSVPVKRHVSKPCITDFELDKVPLGRGAFGVVYRAFLKNESVTPSDGRYRVGQAVAIKMIDKKLIRTPIMATRVRNEVELHRKLKHPAILELFDYFEDDRAVYLVTELCHGELYTYIRSLGRPLSETEAAYFLRQIIRGLQHLHASGILHRDLKLSNLLLQENFRVKIADFGLAVQLRSEHLQDMQKTMCGTPNYLPPEVANSQGYGLPADVWALGIVTFVMLSGEAPFQDTDFQRMLDRIRLGQYQIPDYLSSIAKDFISQLLQQDPKKRPPLDRVLEHPFFVQSRKANALKSKSAVSDRKLVSGLLPNALLYYSGAKRVDASFIDTNRIRPITSRDSSTRYISIDDSGNIILVRDNVHLVIEVSSRIIKVTDNGKSGSFSLDQLSSEYLRYFRYASKYVSLVRAKTPKINYSTDFAKFTLYENGPCADFRGHFKDGSTVIFSSSLANATAEWRKDQEIIQMKLAEDQELPDLNGERMRMFQETDAALRICIDMEISLKEKAFTGQAVSFPVSVRASHSGVKTTICEGASRPNVALNRQSMTIRDAIAPSPLEQAGAAQAAGMSLIQDLVQGEIYAIHFEPNIGWCLAFGDHRYFLLFSDGIMLWLDGHSNTVTYARDTSVGRQRERYSLNAAMPDHVKEKLSHFPRFVSAIRKQS